MKVKALRTKGLFLSLFLMLVATTCSLVTLAHAKEAPASNLDGVTWSADGSTATISKIVDARSLRNDFEAHMDRDKGFPNKIIFEDGSGFTGDASYLFTFNYIAEDDFYTIRTVEGAPKTKGVTSMKGMFEANEGLEEFDFSNFDTSAVTDMSDMFYDANFESLNLSMFDTSQVINMGGMFGNFSIKQLDLSSFDTKNVTNMASMFCYMPELQTLKLGDKFTTAQVKELDNLFDNCTKLNLSDFSFLDFSSATSVHAIFRDCKALQSIDLSKVKVGKSLSNISNMFEGCTQLSSVNLAGFQTGAGTNMNLMFSNCSSLTSLDLSSFNTQAVTDMSYMFASCSALKELDISGFSTEALTTTNAIFSNCNPDWIAVSKTFVLQNDADYPSANYYNLADGTETTASALTASRIQALPDNEIGYFATQKDFTSTVVFWANGGSFAQGTLSKTVSGAAGKDTVAPPATDDLQRLGYTFLGFATNASLEEPDMNPWPSPSEAPVFGLSQNAYYAIWKINSYQVSFDSCGGTQVESQTVDFDSYVKKPAVPTRTGYTFAGWYKDKAYTQAWDFDTDTVKDNTVLYANWTINSYTVSFDSAGGSAIEPQTLNYGELVSKPQDPVREGYTFSGWFCNGVEWNFDTDTVKDNMVLSASWNEVPGPAPAPVVSSGWYEDADGWYFINADGLRLVNCWSYISSSPKADGWYCFDANGYLRVGGWIENASGTWSYVDETGRAYDNGWYLIGALWYDFDENGVMQVGWIWDPSYNSWFYCDSAGHMIQGCWYLIGNTWYGFWANGTMCIGWIWDSSYNNYFYCDPYTGAMYQGCWAWIGDAWYGFWANGEMCYGWILDAGTWYYCDWWSGYMYTGWYQIGDHWYYFYANGAMARNTYVDGWWLGSDGAMW